MDVSAKTVSGQPAVGSSLFHPVKRLISVQSKKLSVPVAAVMVPIPVIQSYFFPSWVDIASTALTLSLVAIFFLFVMPPAMLPPIPVFEIPMNPTMFVICDSKNIFPVRPS